MGKHHQYLLPVVFYPYKNYLEFLNPQYNDLLNIKTYYVCFRIIVAPTFPDNAENKKKL